MIVIILGWILEVFKLALAGVGYDSNHIWLVNLPWVLYPPPPKKKKENENNNHSKSMQNKFRVKHIVFPNVFQITR